VADVDSFVRAARFQTGAMIMAKENWTFDTVHSSINFWVRHLMVSKVHGRFAKWSGRLAFDEQAPENSELEVEIDASSIDTKEPNRDGHLRSPDFFDVEKFPTLQFVGKTVEKTSSNEFKLTGDLTMHGITKPVTLDVEYGGRAKHPQMGERAGFSARGSLHRKDWDLTWNQVLEAGGFALSDKIELILEIEAVKAA
jgi:polyisoprenoid-binding protein YceI